MLIFPILPILTEAERVTSVVTLEEGIRNVYSGDFAGALGIIYLP